MVDINELESASAFGALDGDAIVDGRAVDAMVLRAMRLQANRLLMQPQQAFNLVWPQVTQSLEGLTQYPAEWAMPTDWELLLPPIPVEKMPGLTTATIHFRANIPSGGLALFSVVTGAETNGRLERIGSFTGTGALANYSIPDVRFLPGGYDEVRIYHKTGNTQGALMATGTYGTPAEDTLGTPDILTESSLTDTGAAWSVSPTIASGSHRIQLLTDYGGTGEQVEFDRPITWNSATAIGWTLFTGSNTAYEDRWGIDRLIAAHNLGRAVRYQIRTAQKYNLTQVLGVFDARAS